MDRIKRGEIFHALPAVTDKEAKPTFPEKLGLVFFDVLFGHFHELGNVSVAGTQLQMDGSDATPVAKQAKMISTHSIPTTVPVEPTISAMHAAK